VTDASATYQIAWRTISRREQFHCSRPSRSRRGAAQNAQVRSGVHTSSASAPQSAHGGSSTDGQSPTALFQASWELIAPSRHDDLAQHAGQVRRLRDLHVAIDVREEPIHLARTAGDLEFVARDAHAEEPEQRRPPVVEADEIAPLRTTDPQVVRDLRLVR
jgi:hypothetical protein